MASAWRPGPALALLLLAPFVGEFLLGNLTVAEFGPGIVLAPLYGCGALLVRETARRYGGGLPTMALLAAAYTLIEEGPVDQLLWNDSYAGQDLLHGPSFLPGIGMSVELTQGVLALHTVWSILVPIALVETCAVGRRTTPWPGRTGFFVTALVYVLGAALVFWGNYAEERFLASPAQLAAVGAVVVALVVLAFRMRSWRPRPVPGVAPAPWVGRSRRPCRDQPLLGAFRSRHGGCVRLGRRRGVVRRRRGGIGGVFHWSRQRGWGQRHVFALAAGALMTYLWAAFPVRPQNGGSLAVDLISNAVCAAAAGAVLIRASAALRADRARPRADDHSRRAPQAK